MVTLSDPDPPAPLNQSCSFQSKLSDDMTLIAYDSHKKSVNKLNSQSISRWTVDNEFILANAELYSWVIMTGSNVFVFKSVETMELHK